MRTSCWGEWTAPVKLPPKPSELAFELYSRQWLQERDLKPRTREGYTQLLRNYLMPVLGHMALKEIKPTTVRAWYAQLPPDQPTTRARSYALLKAIMNTAVADELLDHNPCRIRGASNTPRAKDVRAAVDS